MLEDVTETFSSELRNVGMVIDSVWADFDKDGLKDLVLERALMSITIFRNEGSTCLSETAKQLKV